MKRDPLSFDATHDLNARALAEAEASLERDASKDPLWPWPSLNDALGAMLPGHVIVLGGYTGNGKTAVLLNVARHLMFEWVPWAYVGLELSAPTLIQLLAALDAGVARHHVIENTLTEQERLDLAGSFEAIDAHSTTLHFIPEADLTADACAERLRELHAVRGIRVVILDHLHHLNYDGFGSLRHGVSNAIRTLKAVATELQITLIIAAQLRRESGDKAQAFRTPGLSDLMESGTIEQVADIALFTHRQIRPGKLEQLRAFQRGDPSVNLADFALPNRLGLTLAKHRFGHPVGVTVSLNLHVPSDRMTEC